MNQWHDLDQKFPDLYLDFMRKKIKCSGYKQDVDFQLRNYKESEDLLCCKWSNVNIVLLETQIAILSTPKNENIETTFPANCQCMDALFLSAQIKVMKSDLEIFDNKVQNIVIRQPPKVIAICFVVLHLSLSNVFLCLCR